MGAQTKVEGDRLSIPSTLNMAALTTFGYEKTNAVAAGAAAVTPGTNNDGNGTVYTPGHNGELSLFFGGRINDNAGFLTEVGLIGPADQSSAKMPILFEVTPGTRAGIVPFTTNGQGASYGFEVLNTGANAVHQMSGVGGFNGAHSNAISAQQYIGTGAAATGVAFVVNNPSYFINATKYNQMGSGDLTGGGNSTGSGSVMSAGMDSTYLRAAYIFDMGSWDTGVGVQSWSGSSVCMPDTIGQTCDVATPGGPALVTTTKATAIDGQMQGELNKMPVGFYVSLAKAPYDAVTPNSYNMGGTMDRSSFNVSAEVGVLPGIATLGAAIRRAKSGADEGLLAGGPATGANASDNAIMVTATYKLSQNMMASLSYTSNSGGYWTQGNIDAMGSKTTTLNLFTLF
jgi:hypothetical protein